MFVTVTSVAAMLVMASAPSDDMDLARTVYSNCVIDKVIAHLDSKTAENESKTLLSGVCETEKKAFFNAVVKYERSEGSTAAEAKEFADEEVQMILDDNTESYAEHFANDTRPVKGV